MRRSQLSAVLSAALFVAPALRAWDDDDDGKRTIAGLTNIQMIGSTANILDLNGKPAMVDSDPYKIAVVPNRLNANLLKGDVLVSNVGNDVGMTIVHFRPFPSTGTQFNAANAGIKGPSGLAFDRGKLLVANSKGNSVQILNADGTLFTSVTDAMFNNPWSVSTGVSFNFAPLYTFFTANKGDAKILRVDVMPTFAAVPTFKVTQIGQFDKVAGGGPTKIDVLWLPFLRVGQHLLVDVLLASDPVNNRIAAFANASILNGTTGMGTTVFQGKPLNVPGGIAVNPFNNDLLVVNLNDNNLVELNAENAKVVATKTLDPLVVDAQGNNSALFGVLAIRDGENLRVYFTDDNTNTLNVLSAAPVKAQARD